MTLAQARKARGLTQAEVAMLIGISQNTYCRYENGTREPNAEMIYKISKVLRLQPKLAWEIFIEPYGVK